MTNNSYDLYYFDQSQVKEWINYKEGENNVNPGFGLVAGKGYLYANSGDGENSQVTLTFTGTPYDGDGTVDLDYTGNGTFLGWNLVGNPYDETAYFSASNPFYRMNESHTGLIAEATTGAINRLEGVFVLATETGQSVQFTTTAPNTKRSSLALNVSRNNSVIDRAIVGFGNSNTLPKFQLFKNSTRIYIAQDGEDYAVVAAEKQGNMPVSFKASENGSYTLSVNTTEVEMSYLHLIDNLTGADIDLLSNPSYTFNAQTGDNEARFRLVFSAKSDNENLDESFAFMSDGQLIVNGEGTLQVFDVLGHQILTKELSVFRSQFSVFNAPGVYVLRLTDGTNVRTQKIVVE